METLGSPDKITFLITPKKRIEIIAGQTSREKASNKEHYG
jgi:uncharacterized protein YggU (UPF0235/DUF167 family)